MSIQEKLEAESESMWRKNELTTEEYYAARYFIRRYTELLKEKEENK